MKPSDINCGELFKAGKFSEPGGRPQPCATSGEKRYGGRVARGAGTIFELIVAHAQPYSDLPVIDATGLKGNFEWEIAIPTAKSRDEWRELMRTAFEDQLGLRLEERIGPFEVIVIDDVRMPTPN